MLILSWNRLFASLSAVIPEDIIVLVTLALIHRSGHSSQVSELFTISLDLFVHDRWNSIHQYHPMINKAPPQLEFTSSIISHSSMHPNRAYNLCLSFCYNTSLQSVIILNYPRCCAIVGSVIILDPLCIWSSLHRANLCTELFRCHSNSNHPPAPQLMVFA